MLEYYTVDADYLDSLALTEELLSHLVATNRGNIVQQMQGPFLRITMEEAFRRWAGFSLYECAAAGQPAMEAEARRLGLDPPPGLDTAALYDLIFIHAVESALPQDKVVALLDYPAFVPCLAQKGKDGKTMDRWELYVQGIELANCYSEETDPEAVRHYFEAEAAEKEKSALVRHGIDRTYWKNFLPSKSGNFPPCSGVALGLDRLIMALWSKSTIDGVLPFAQ
jgi:lysyl-tRNA synthetase class 2